MDSELDAVHDEFLDAEMLLRKQRISAAIQAKLESILAYQEPTEADLAAQAAQPPSEIVMVPEPDSSWKGKYKDPADYFGRR